MAISSVTVRSAATDGTNIFLEIEIYNGTVTMPTIRPYFPSGTTAATITTYLTNIANNRPSLAADIVGLVGTSIAGS